MTAIPNHYLDITGETCPMTFVKVKLAMEKMRGGETLEVRLKGDEPLRNVPRSVAGLGYRVLSLASEPDDPAGGVHRLLIAKP